MTVHGQFRDIDDNLIDVTIENTKVTGATIEMGTNIQFNGDPISITDNIDDSFEPIIKKSATINLVTQAYVGNLFFAGNARDVKVLIKRNNVPIFSGYVEPNTFTQGYANPLEEFTLNCVDYLSTLQYSKYNFATASNYEALKKTADVKTFRDILVDTFDEAEGEKHIYFDLSKGLESGSEDTLFDDVAFNENYMYGSTFDDVWQQDKMIEEALKYLNLHIIQEGVDFYIFDRNTLRNGRTQWLDLLSGITETKTVQTIALTSSDHADSDTNITVEEVFSQVKVKCELKNSETVIESPLNKDSLASYYNNRFHYMKEYIGDGRDAWFYAVTQGRKSNKVKEVEWFFRPMYNKKWKLNALNGQTIDSLVEYDANGEAYRAWGIAKYMKDHQIVPLLCRFGSIENPEGTPTDNSPVPSISEKDYLIISVNGNANDDPAQASPSSATLESRQPIVEYVGSNSGGVYSPTDNATTNYIVFSGRMTLQPRQWETDHYNNVCTTTPSRDPFTHYDWRVPVDGGSYFYTRRFYQNAYPSQENDLTSTYVMMQPPVPNQSFEFAGDTDWEYFYSAVGEGQDLFSKLPVLECELLIGNKRLVEYNMDEYGHSSFAWVNKNSGIQQEYVDEDGVTQTYLKKTFSIGIDPKMTDILLGKEYDIQNTVTYKMNIDAKGMAIPIKKSDALSGKVEFKILGPVNLSYIEIVRRHPSFWRHTKWYENTKLVLTRLENIIISDFQAKIVTDGANIDATDESKDLIYMSAENTDYYATKEQTFKFVTQLSGTEAAAKGISPTICMNAVIDSSTGMPLTSIYNATTHETAKAEEHYVDDYWREYSAPKIMLNATLHDGNRVNFRNKYTTASLNGSTFTVQSISRNIKYNTATLTLKQI